MRIGLIRTAMEFPTDVWDVIMSFYHSIYREPSHYKAIMGFDIFRNRIQNESTNGNTESFYMHLVVSSWWYWAFPDIQDLMVAPEVVFRRGVAIGTTKEDFINLYDNYACSCSNNHTMGYIQYEM